MNKILLFLIASVCLSACSSQKNTGLQQSKNGDILYVQGKPFIINGMNWGYSPIGTNYEYSLWQQPEETIKAALEYDMSRLQSIGVNTLRIYTGIPNKWITYIYENYGIYTMLNHSFGRYGLSLNGTWTPHTNYGDSLSQSLLLAEVTALAKNYKNTPGLLLYLLGNENNYGLYWQGAETEDIPTRGTENDQKAKDLYTLFNKAAVAIKKEDTTHPVAICNGDLEYIDLIVSQCTDIDILGINIYRGKSFGNAFSEVKKKYNKPILFTEFGADAFNSKTRQEDQAAQAEYALSNWKDVYENAAGLGKSENCLGGFTFQWSDGWWKTGQTINLDKHDSTASWSNGGYYHDFVKGQKNMNEEWFGICAKGQTLANGTYTLYPRAAYYVLQKIHKLNPYEKGNTTEKLNEEFSKIKLSEAIEKAKLLPRQN